MKLYILSINKISPNDILGAKKDFPKRAEKAEKYTKEADRLRSVAVAVLLGRVYGVTEKDVLKTEKGKPYVLGKDGFSVAHSGEFAVLFTGSGEVGVDLEKKRDDVKVFDKVLSEDEKTSIREGRLTFQTAWCMKESLMKFDGLKTYKAPKRYDVSPFFNGGCVTIDGKTAYNYTFEKDGYVFSLTAQSKVDGLSVEIITL